MFSFSLNFVIIGVVNTALLQKFFWSLSYVPRKARIISRSVTQYIYQSLQFSCVTRQDVRVICDTDTAHTDRSDPKSKVGGVGCSEARVNITLKMACSPLMALSVPFVLLELSTKPTVLLDVGRSILIRVTTIL